MIHRKSWKVVAAGAAVGVCGIAVSFADTDIDTVDRFAWAENVGWLNWRDANNGADGVEVRGDHLAGYIWGENIGWINVGNGSGPYANTDNTNFGVNIAVDGSLSGFAWGENVGWINFSGGAMAAPPQPARLDAGAMRFFGYAWGENIGWINLDDSGKFVGVDIALSLCTADLQGDFDVDLDDFSIFIAQFGNGPVECALGCTADLEGDDDVDLDDFSIFIAQFGNGPADCNPNFMP